MSKITKYIKRGLEYVFYGQPKVTVSPNIVTLSPNELLKGRTALITGGTRGIGRAIAESFLNAGANVIITSRKQLSADLVAAELQRKYPSLQVRGIEMDSSSVEQIRCKFVEITSNIAPQQISILVNNAGIMGGSLGETSSEEFSKIFDTNLKGAFFLSEYVVKYMRDHGIEGNILMLASSSSLRPAVSAYALSKWGLRGFIKGLAKLCAPIGITVNGIAPGPTATEMQGKEDKSDIYREKSPIQRYTMPEEIANMATILCSDMGRSIVGDIIYMTGGSGMITYDDIEYKI